MNYDSEKTESDIPQKKKKSKRSILALIINIITGIVVVLALVFTIQAFYARKHIHNNYFGYAALPVESNSMWLENGGKDNFKRGDLIFVKLLDAEEKRNLEIGDVITFKFFNMNEDAESLNTHRIIEVRATGYVTQGDAIVEVGNKPTEQVSFDSVVGVFKGKVGALGHASLFMQEKEGMFIMIVVPFILLLLVSIFYFFRNFRAYSKEKTEDATESAIMSERDRLRQEILAEMQRNQGGAPSDTAPPEPQIAPVPVRSAPIVQPEEASVEEIQPIAEQIEETTVEEIQLEIQPEAEQIEEVLVEPEVQPEVEQVEETPVESEVEPVSAAKPATTKSTTAKSSTTKPATTKSTAAKTTAAKTGTAKTTAAKTGAAKTTAAKTGTAKTTAAKSTTAKSTAAKTPAAKKSTTNTTADKMPAPKSNIAKTAAREAAAKVASAKTGAAKSTTAKTGAAKKTTTKPKQ